MDNKNKIGVALTKELCPICCKEVDGPIVMNTRLSVKAAKEVENANGKVIGWAKKPCKDCQEHIDNGVFFVIGIDMEKSEPGNPYRTGHIVGLKNTSEFVKQLDGEYKKRNAVMMDYREMIKLGMINEQSNTNI